LFVGTISIVDLDEDDGKESMEGIGLVFIDEF
jgi:hypothetical protein